MAITKSEALFKEAVQYIPGGVNSPVRAFGSIGSTPRFIKKADKALMWDEDDNEYIDFIGSWGPMILGHNHPLVLERDRTTEEGRGVHCDEIAETQGGFFMDPKKREEVAAKLPKYKELKFPELD